jgi:acyl carrier protein
LSGTGLARGYLNDPETTDSHFVANPFHPSARMYKTGDLGYWLPDGNIVFVGRRDTQVKIRGYRIELGEIESVIAKSGWVESVCVLVKKDAAGGNCLVAYVVPSGQVPVADLPGLLKKKLPAYMVPEYFEALAAMPLLPNGKLDRNALPEPAAVRAAGSALVQPADDIEHRLVAIWQTVLARETISVEDNFFQIGGNSLNAIRLVGLVNEAFAQNINITTLFTYGTIRGVATVIAEKLTGRKDVPNAGLDEDFEDIKL